MTVTSTTIKDRKGPGNGVTTVHSFNIPGLVASYFKLQLINRADESVYLEPTQGAGSNQYQVAVASDFASITVTLGATLAAAFDSTRDLLVYRETPKTQTVSVPYDNNLPPKTAERSVYDKLVMMAQEQQEQLDRCLKVPVRLVSSFSGDLPASLTGSTGKAIIVNDTEDGFTLTESDLTTLEGNAATVAANIANVNTVAGINAAVSTVAGISAATSTVAGISANVTTVAGIAANVTAVAGNATNINAVNANAANINTVAGANANITTLAGINANITTVAGISAAVSTVAANNANITTVATNMASVINAANNIPKANRTATTNPTVSDDNTQGYSAASIWVNTSTNAVFMCTNAATGAAVWVSVLGSNEYADNLFRIFGSTDATKKVAFEVDGLTTATTRTVTVPDKSGTLAMTSDLPGTATTSAQGIVELATDAETQTGTDTARVAPVSSLVMHQGVAKVWANFNNAGTLQDSYGVSSVTKNGTGDYTVNFSTNFANASFAASVTVNDNAGCTTATKITTKAVGSIRVVAAGTCDSGYSVFNNGLDVIVMGDR